MYNVCIAIRKTVKNKRKDLAIADIYRASYLASSIARMNEMASLIIGQVYLILQMSKHSQFPYYQ